MQSYSTNNKLSFAVALLLLVVVACACPNGNENSRYSNSKGAPPTPTPPCNGKVAEAQALCADVTKKSVRAGVIHRVAVTNGALGGHIVEVWVRPPFYLLSYDVKENMAKVLFACHCADDPSSLMFFDSLNGQIVGTFTPTLGLEMK